ncbi:GNAT family N-acetyltransferase [uncultured Alistipes sp.]|uniref:GNAT family N-acetyltransferase n=1 Tax=uncultured Alistipes sp. TaxID=538949 RepID=UPI002665D6DE|nr:GNAT family N-acetyltransferase [uncultured Alistipes sp.]
MLTIRDASERDIDLIRRLAGEAFPATYRELLTPGQLDYMMKWMYSEASLRRQLAEGHHYFIAETDGEPCGYLSVERQGPDLFHLQKIYVLPRYQGIGAGAALFRHAVAYIRGVHPGRSLMELNVNRQNRALHFYEHMGMRRLREGDFPIGEGYYMNDYIMGLEID